MEDVSSLLPGDPITALSPTSQAGGNMMSSNRYAMTAPGSQPTDPLPPAKDQGDPKITPSLSPGYTTDFESPAVTPTRGHASNAPAPLDFTDPPNGVDAGPDSPHPGMSEARKTDPWTPAENLSSGPGRWTGTPKG